MAELHPLSLGLLLRRALLEFQREGKIFDLPSAKFYRPSPAVDTSVRFYGRPAATPVGPAAGPHTQLAQNIVLSWLAGARIIELKTIQVNDRLTISRPCIDVRNVGYNVEWSQELRLEESLREYVAAHMLIEILQNAKVLDNAPGSDGLPGPSKGRGASDTLFDISVGYDLAGITSPQVRHWLQSMKQADAQVDELRREIPQDLARYRDLDFHTELASSVTLSTFHGCPAGEIERIVEFLLTEMGFDVTIKMNPPMLGKERLEYLLHEKMGYHDIDVNPRAYETGITFDEAVEVVRRLKRVAKRHGREVGVKLTNTLEVINRGTFLKDNIAYLSGAPLHVLAMTLVGEWRKVFGAEIPISFSAGIDQHNFADAVAINLVPITTCTDLLRPGGYGRLPKYLRNLEGRLRTLGVKNVGDYIVKWGGHGVKAIEQVCETAVRQAREKLPQILFEKVVESLSQLEQQWKENLVGEGVDLRRIFEGWLESFEHRMGKEFPWPKGRGLYEELVNAASLLNTPKLVAETLENPRYFFEQNRTVPRKIGRHLVLFDCINCDKCIPVCPNDANFGYEVEPLEIAYSNFQLASTGPQAIPGGVFTVNEAHQLATYADFCNECGNCDVFCPEDGGPYNEKPRLFGSRKTWERHRSLDGFFFERRSGFTYGLGRIRGKEYRLEIDDATQRARFSDEVIEVAVNWKTHQPVKVAALRPDGEGHVLEMQNYFIMAVLAKGVLNSSQVNFINVKYATTQA